MGATRNHSDEEICSFLFESGLTLENFTIEEFNGGYAILSQRPGAEAGLWIIDDEPMRQSCLDYLMNNGAKHIRLG